LAEGAEDLSNGVLVHQNQLSSIGACHAHVRGTHAYNSAAADKVNGADLFERG
jgi:hypothetical protein